MMGSLVNTADLVLLPGWPLSHADHRYSTMVTLDHVDRDVPIVFYAEQPYASEPLNLVKGLLRDHTVAPLTHAYGAGVRWKRIRPDRGSRKSQARAMSCYGGELQQLGVRGRWSKFYRLAFGEWLGIGERSALPFDLPCS
jgi:hypothetical protein